MHSTMIDSTSTKLSGLMKPWIAGEHAAGDAAEARAHREREQLHVARVDAHRGGRDLVLADRHPCAADARILQPHVDDDDDDQRHAGSR